MSDQVAIIAILSFTYVARELLRKMRTFSVKDINAGGKIGPIELWLKGSGKYDLPEGVGDED